MTTYAQHDSSITTIDGIKFEIKLLCTSDAYQVGENIFKLVAPSVGTAIDGAFTDSLLETPTTAAEMAMFLVRQLRDVDTLEMIKSLLGDTTANGEGIDFDNFFKGRNNKYLIPLIQFAIEENFGSLFTEMGLMEKLKSFALSLIPQTQEQEEEQSTQ